MNREFDTTAWGRANQKMLLIFNNDFTELQEHLKDGCWIIESISACSQNIYENIRPSCYVVLTRN